LLLGMMQLRRRRSVLWSHDAIRRRGNLQKRTNLLHAGQPAVALQVLRYITCYYWADFDDHVPRRLRELQHIGRDSQLLANCAQLALKSCSQRISKAGVIMVRIQGSLHLSCASVKASTSSYVSNGPMMSGSVGVAGRQLEAPGGML
jgi:hypothetical protein